MIICNGVPKAGTSLLLLYCALANLQDSGILIRKYSSKMPFCVTKFPKKKKNDFVILDEILLGEELDFNNNWFCHSHLVYKDYAFIKKHTVVTIFRDPRNMAISFIRDNNRRRVSPITNNDLIRVLRFGEERKFFNTNWKGTWVDHYREYLPWFDHSSNCIFFEDFLDDDNIKALAGMLNINVDVDFMQKYLFGNKKTLPTGGVAYAERSTWSGKASNWEEWWNEEIDIIWNDIGGPELLNDIETLRGKKF